MSETPSEDLITESVTHEQREIVISYQVKRRNIHQTEAYICNQFPDKCQEKGIKMETFHPVEVSIDGTRYKITELISVVFQLPPQLRQQLSTGKLLTAIFCAQCYVEALGILEENPE